ncbi:Signal transduction histidine kinase [Anaerocolumna jejuensis DSM 15929]|uniref:histidine kinase n=1 Tax=Anaerocolumna jejuensis DSM 15929 TaxID=1121322 RepID=A0A1M7BW76_9FIRM|nr:HAMP domain-containing sensor histidine kinase [Anaerocolumna jejuensis]SHL58829.1 Signal transduction histidine kinase [Anaerocolumna jejuensis DSM 15929]
MHKHKRKRQASLWQYFVLIVFGILVMTSVIMYVIIIFAINTDLLVRLEFSLPFATSAVLAISILIGTIITSLVGKRILAPITKLNYASREIAGGNFDVRLDTISQIKEITETFTNFNQMAHELSSIEMMRNDFIANISHEFKTPIAAIEGYATLLQDSELTEEERVQYTQMILESTKQFSALSSNILKLSKLENQEKILEPITYRLDEQLRQSILFLENSWTEKELELELDLPKTFLYGNEDLMMQVWTNLLSNAIKFTPKGGQIRITLESSPKLVSVSVKDTGIGISIQEKKHIFEKFYQVDKSRTHEGNGLGLSLVYRIVSLCGGTIQVQSEPGQGSEFTVQLPNTINSPI